jgi:hypothetical protein
MTDDTKAMEARRSEWLELANQGGVLLTGPDWHVEAPRTGPRQRPAALAEVDQVSLRGRQGA